MSKTNVVVLGPKTIHFVIHYACPDCRCNFFSPRLEMEDRSDHIIDFVARATRGRESTVCRRRECGGVALAQRVLLDSRDY